MLSEEHLVFNHKTNIGMVKVVGWINEERKEKKWKQDFNIILFDGLHSQCKIFSYGLHSHVKSVYHERSDIYLYRIRYLLKGLMHNDIPCATLFDFIRDQDLKFIQLISNNVHMCIKKKKIIIIMYTCAKLQLISLSENRL